MSEYGLCGDWVNGTKEVTHITDGKLQDSGSGSQNVDDGINIVVEVGPSLINFVDEAPSWPVAFISLAPYDISRKWTLLTLDILYYPFFSPLFGKSSTE